MRFLSSSDGGCRPLVAGVINDEVRQMVIMKLFGALNGETIYTI